MQRTYASTTSVFWKLANCSECSALLNCWCKLNYVVEETHKLVSISKSEGSTTVTTKLAGDNAFHLEQDKSLALDEGNIWQSPSNTSLALSTFEVVNSNILTQSVSRGFPARCVVYECALSSFPAQLAPQPSSELRRRANARNVNFRTSLRWPIHIINPGDQTYFLSFQKICTLLVFASNDWP